MNFKVAQSLSVLIIHNLVDYKLNSKQIIEYKLITKNVLNFLKYPLYINLTTKSKDDYAAEIVKELLQHGYLEMSNILLKILSKSINESPSSKDAILRDVNQIDSYYTNIRESFVQLVETKFVERLPNLDNSNKTQFNEEIENESSKQAEKVKSKVPRFSSNDEEKSTIPYIKIDGDFLKIFI